MIMSKGTSEVHVSELSHSSHLDSCNLAFKVCLIRGKIEVTQHNRFYVISLKGGAKPQAGIRAAPCRSSYHGDAE